MIRLWKNAGATLRRTMMGRRIITVAVAGAALGMAACRLDSRADNLGDDAPRHFGLGRTPTATEIGGPWYRQRRGYRTSTGH